MSRSNNTTNLCKADPRWMIYDPSGCYLAGWRHSTHQCIWPKTLSGRRVWKRSQRYRHWTWSVPSWYRKSVNKQVRGRLNSELRDGQELSDWHKWGTGRIGWYW